MNKGISNSKGDYLIMIGDDDVVSPYILDIVEKMKVRNIDSLSFPNIFYYWPDVLINKTNDYNKPGNLYIPRNTLSSEFIEINVESEFIKLLSNGALSWGKYLPHFYHGIIKRDIILIVKEKFGCFVPGSSPDMATTVALSQILKINYYINYPFSVMGASKKSAAGQGLNNSHYGELSKTPWLPKNIENTWDANLPKIWTGPTILAQSTYEVLSIINDQRKINYLKTYAFVLAYIPNVRKIVFPFVIGKLLKRPLDVFGFLLYFTQYYLRSLFLNRNKLKARFNNTKVVSDINSIMHLMDYLKKIGSPSKINLELLNEYRLLIRFKKNYISFINV